MKKIRLIAAFFLFLLPVFSMDIIIEAEMLPEVYDYSAQAGYSGVSVLKEASFFPMVNFSSKGLPGLQTNLFIGGGTFEQAAVYIDGVPVNDPQTGHYNMDLPLPDAVISGVKVINNAGAFAGAGALSGLVEFSTLMPERDFFGVSQEFGTYDTFETGAQASKKIDDYRFYLAGSTSGSRGYREGTDFYRHSAFAKILLPGGARLTGGYEEKNYGAFDFYTPGAGFHSREHIITRLASLASEPYDGLKVIIFGRNHYDRFILDNNNPSFYMNIHNNASYGISAAQVLRSEAGVFRFVLRPIREEIQSSNLGNRYRMKVFGSAGWFAEPAEGFKTNINFGVQFLEASEMPDLMPSANASQQINENFGVFAGWGMSSRHPNFTELYYNDPKNEGNPGLKPEHSQQTNVGVKFEAGGLAVKISGFYRYGTDMIDWGKTDLSEVKWKIRNIGVFTTAGASFYAEYDAGGLSGIFSYAYTDSSKKAGYISKYGALYLRNKLAAGIEAGGEEAGVSAGYLYKDYSNRQDAMHGLFLSAHYMPVKYAKISLAVDNALNINFEETPGVPAPGRVITLGIDYEYE